MNHESQKTIGVFFGSQSPEHDVSIITGQLVISGLNKMGYEVVPVYLGKDGGWYLDQKLGSLDFFKEKNIQDRLSKFDDWYLDLKNSKNKMVFHKKGFGKKDVVIDIAFPALHGRNGEDGTIQGLFELTNTPYIGCDVTSSAVAMDKALTKSFYKEQNINTTEFIIINKNDWEKDKKTILNKAIDLGQTLFVKPTRTGSSIGITKVSSTKELEFAIDVAFHYDNKIIVEKAVENMVDLTCSVIGHSNSKVSLVQESKYSKELFSYEDKYIRDGGAQLGEGDSGFIIPANIDTRLTTEIQELSKKVFKVFGCSGIARIDFLYNKKDEVLYVNEINTMPGTIYHHLWKKSGVDLSALLSTLIESALEKHKEKNKITKSFNSSILDNTNTSKLATKLNIKK